jgi:hypothetical protein
MSVVHTGSDRTFVLEIDTLGPHSPAVLPANPEGSVGVLINNEQAQVTLSWKAAPDPDEERGYPSIRIYWGTSSISRRVIPMTPMFICLTIFRRFTHKIRLRPIRTMSMARLGCLRARFTIGRS